MAAQPVDNSITLETQRKTRYMGRFSALILTCIFFVLRVSKTDSNEVDGSSKHHYYRWLTLEAAQIFVDELDSNEASKEPFSHRGKDRRNSTPMVTGDAFRHMVSPSICDESNRCRPDLDKLTKGDCVFINQDSFPWFGSQAVLRIKEPYILVTHNGDLSTPDGQNDAGLGLPRYNTTTVLQAEFEAGRLLALHSENLWWNDPKTKPKPAYAHCLPIGIENRYNWIGYFSLFSQIIIVCPCFGCHSTHFSTFHVTFSVT